MQTKSNFTYRFDLLLSFVFFFLSSFSFSQNSTYSPSEQKQATTVTEQKRLENRKILVIPFEPKLYMSEIDQNVNKETKLNFSQIRNAFRSGLNFSMVSEFKKKFSVVSLMNDTSQARKEQQYIYSSIAYKYDVVPDSTGKAGKDNVANEPKIHNGQITVATNNQKKYMNTKITNPNLLATLHKKYGTEVFVFINQLDLKINVDNSGNASNGNFDRTAGVHYSIFDLNGHLLSAGLATKNFPPTVNNPNKIVNDYFSDVAQTILESYISATKPQQEKNKGLLQWQDGK